MTRPAPVHAVPLLDHSPHVASPACPCRPTPATDLAEPGRAVYVHSPMADRPEPRRIGKAW